MPKIFSYKGKNYDFTVASIRYAEVKKQLPRVFGTVAVNFFKDSFRRQGWSDKRLVKWTALKKPSKGRAILIRRGHLRNSIHVNTANFNRIEIGSNLPYAAAHNNGVESETVSVRAHTRRQYANEQTKYTTKSGKERSRTDKVETSRTTVRSHTREMNLPQRQFMGDSEMMNRKLDAVTIKAIDAIFDF